MPTMQSSVGNDGIRNVTCYLLSLSAGQATAAKINTSRQTFSTLREPCHAADGCGLAVLAPADLTDIIRRRGAFRSHSEESIAIGCNAVMPSHKKWLGEAKVHVLAAYVYGLNK